MFTKAFWKATAERVIRGAAITVAAVLGLSLDGTGTVSQVALPELGVTALYGALGALVLCLAGGAFGAGDGPSLTGREEVSAPPVNEEGVTALTVCAIALVVIVVLLLLAGPLHMGWGR